jgi:hypothetical protein
MIDNAPKHDKKFHFERNKCFIFGPLIDTYFTTA